MEEGNEIVRLRAMVGSYVSNQEVQNSILKGLEELFNYKRMFMMVERFQETFEPKEYDPNLRFELLREELEEFLLATEDGNDIEELDALVDMMYILIGTIIKAGYRNIFYSAFKEVHLSNMSKLEDGKVLRREDGKVLKGSKYRKPDFTEIIKRAEKYKK